MKKIISLLLIICLSGLVSCATTEAPNGTYYIRNKQTGYYADIQGPTMADGTTIHQWQFHGKNSQRWIFEHQGNGFYTIRSANSTTPYYLGVINDEVVVNSDIVLRDDDITGGMLWNVSVTDSGAFKLTAQKGYALDYALATTTSDQTNGAKLIHGAYVDNNSYRDEWEFVRLLPLSGYELDYNETIWSGTVSGNCNCYAYAINNQVLDSGDIWFKQQPGAYSGIVLDLTDFNAPASDLINAVSTDFDYYNENYSTNLVFTTIGQYEICPSGTYKVALVVNPGKDYHWYRQDSDGLWSHKQGITPVKRTDESGNLIIDPQTANRGEYTQFIGYFAVSPWNRYYSSALSLTSLEELNLEHKIVSSQKITEISVGMTYKQVSEILGTSGIDIGSGAILYRYVLDNSTSVIINYSHNIDGQLIVCNIIYE